MKPEDDRRLEPPTITRLDRLVPGRRARKLADHRARTLGRTLRERAELIERILR